MQIKGQNLGWGNPVSSWEDWRRVKDLAFESTDYRLKPAPPTKLHADITDDGRLAHAYACGDKLPYPPPMPGTNRVTYVLENPDANG